MWGGCHFPQPAARHAGQAGVAASAKFTCDLALPGLGRQDRRVATLFLMVGLPGAGKTTRGRKSWPPAHLTIAANGVIANHN